MFFSRPSSSVSANSWISASGVFRSCDTLETKFDFSSATRTSRAARARDEEDAERHDAGEHRHHRALRPRARRDDVGNRLVAVAGAHAPASRLAAFGRGERLPAPARRTRAGTSARRRTRRWPAPPAGNTHAVRRRRGPSRPAAGSRSVLRRLASLLATSCGRNSRRSRSASTRKRDEAGQLIARREREPQLRLEVRPPAVDRRLEDRDRALLRRELVEPLDQQRRFGQVGDEAVCSPIVGEHLAAVLGRDVGPDVEPSDERIGDRAPARTSFSMNAEIERLGLRAGRSSAARRCAAARSASCKPLRHAVGGFLAQLAQDDRRRLAEGRQSIGTGNRTGSRPEWRRRPRGRPRGAGCGRDTS